MTVSRKLYFQCHKHSCATKQSSFVTTAGIPPAAFLTLSLAFCQGMCHCMVPHCMVCLHRGGRGRGDCVEPHWMVGLSGGGVSVWYPTVWGSVWEGGCHCMEPLCMAEGSLSGGYHVSSPTLSENITFLYNSDAGGKNGHKQGYHSMHSKQIHSKHFTMIQWIQSCLVFSLLIKSKCALNYNCRICTITTVNYKRSISLPCFHFFK